MRWPTLEDFLIYVVIVIAVVVMFWVLFGVTGCASKQEKWQLRYINGCSIEVMAVQNTTGDSVRNIDFEDCKAGSESSNTKEREDANEKESEQEKSQ